MANVKSRRSAGHIAAFAVAVAAGLVVEWAKGFPLTRLLGRVFTWLWATITADITVPAWLFALAAILALAFLAAVAIRLRRSGHDWRRYRHDNFLEVVWLWDYVYDEIASSTLAPICPRCNYQMSVVDASVYRANPRTTLRCDDCGYTRQFEDSAEALWQRVIKLIQRKLRTGEYVKAVPPA